MEKYVSFTVKQSFSHLQSMSKDLMLKDDQKMLPTHTLKVSVMAISKLKENVKSMLGYSLYNNITYSDNS